MKRNLMLPDGRNLDLHDSVSGLLSVGVLVITGIQVGPGDPVKPEIARIAARHRELYAGLVPSEIAPLKEARDLYKSVGISPSRTRPSSEALLRRILKGVSLYSINNTVDVCNLASLAFLLPIGLYDLNLIQGNVTLRLGCDGESYPGIRKGPVNLQGRLGLFDEFGPFGSPTSDSQRTSVSQVTTDLLAVIMATAGYSSERMLEHVGLLSEWLQSYCGGREASTEVMIA